MTSPQDSHILLRAFADELARCGLRHASTSPGSRSAPLVVALARQQRIHCWSHLDERVSGFFAIGMAKAIEAPTVVTTTSGTAAANLAPAVYEAHTAGVPLIVLTADRPAELREVGAGQVIDQVKLYGSAVKLFCEVAVDTVTPQTLNWIRGLACRAYWTASQGAPGPVHLNFPLREPLVADLPLPDDHSGRSDGSPRLSKAPARPEPGRQALASLAQAVEQAPRGVVVCGRLDGAESAKRVAAFATKVGYPLLADPLSGARITGPAIAYYDALLRDQGFCSDHSPDLVLRIGDLPTSKPLRTWLAALDSLEQIALDPNDRWQDPDGVVTQSLAADVSALTAVGDLVLRSPSSEWLKSWREGDDRAALGISSALQEGLSEPRVAVELGSLRAEPFTLFVASSMPIRDVESFFPATPSPRRVLANRGANGIDGTISCALGVAAIGAEPVVLLIGDVAFAYDATALITARRLAIDLTIVLINNDGGGIFSFLPIASETDVFESQIATPHGVDFAALSHGLGARHQEVKDLDALGAALRASTEAAGVDVIEIRTTREANVAIHGELWRAVSGALRQAP
ncbi:MAG: 2-succinyl-5-enolpyruvyl-6-hydroxy-3-cyclohexene-1-carboxylic-acid synthase [Actinomycetota bacterium]